MLAAAATADVAVVCCGARLLAGNRQEQILPSPLGAAFENQTGLFLAGTFIVKREIFDQVGGYVTGLVGAENTEFSLRLLPHVLRRGLRIVTVPMPLAVIHGGSLTRTADDQRFLRGAQFILQHHYDKLSKEPHRCAAFHAVIGVGLARMGEFAGARQQFFRAAQVFPIEWRHWLRALAATTPAVARRIWKTSG